MTTVGLRIDVDTLRGTRIGVPNLLASLARYRIKSSFFFSVGPDNMGRHITRLLRPTFFMKMLRSGAPSLYGWDILFKGTLWPGPIIGKKCATVIRQTAASGHEIGLHAWDHHLWQTRLTRLDETAITGELQKGYESLTSIVGTPPSCFAAPAWQVTPSALAALRQFSFAYHSNCRGKTIFCPINDNNLSHPPEIPVTLPTFDEIIGRTCGIDEYNDYLLATIKASSFNVLTIHAEAEGIGYTALFHDFLEKSHAAGITFRPLGSLILRDAEIPRGSITEKTMAGREGWISCQDA